MVSETRLTQMDGRFTLIEGRLAALDQKPDAKSDVPLSTHVDRHGGVSLQSERMQAADSRVAVRRRPRQA